MPPCGRAITVGPTNPRAARFAAGRGEPSKRGGQTPAPAPSGPVGGSPAAPLPPAPRRARALNAGR